MGISLVFLVSFVGLLWSLSPFLSPFRDAGDLAIAATTLGIAHPPGYPLYVTLGHAVHSLVPFANSAYRLNLLSALSTAGATTLIFVSARKLLHHIWLPVLSATVFLAAWPVWFQSTISEVYTLSTLFLALLILLGQVDTLQGKRIFLLSFLFGLGLGNHHMLILAFPACLLWWFSRRSEVTFSKNMIAGSLFFGLLGLSCYIYLPLRAEALYLWDEPQKLSGFWNIITRGDYGAGTLSTRYSTSPLIPSFIFYLKVLYKEAGWLTVILGLVGFVGAGCSFCWRTIFAVFLCTGPLFGALTRLQPSEFSQAILSPALVLPLVPLSLLVSGSVSRLLEWKKPAGIGMTIIVAFVLILQLHNNVSGSPRWNLAAHDYGQGIFRTIPLRSVLLMISDAPFFTVGYLQNTLQSRNDIAVISDTHIPWRWKQARQKFPGMVPPGTNSTEEFLKNNTGRLILAEGTHPFLVNASCPRGPLVRIDWPERSDSCIQNILKSRNTWQFITRRIPRETILESSYYTRDLLRTLSANAYNAGTLLKQAGDKKSAIFEWQRALLWNAQDPTVRAALEYKEPYLELTPAM